MDALERVQSGAEGIALFSSGFQQYCASYRSLDAVQVPAWALLLASHQRNGTLTPSSVVDVCTRAEWQQESSSVGLEQWCMFPELKSLAIKDKFAVQ